ncbi:MAG TPA: ABC transporter permease [Gemmatimonadaceae bacterium]|nr:ABC transporter permease [Gemmatimonadaceae bacterium]
MAWYHAIVTAFDALVHRGREERRMDDEMRFHLEMEARRLVREEKMSEEDAAVAATRAFGGVERYKDAVRDERGTSWLEDLAQDARFAVRTLRRRPGFTAVASLTLALGIGASTALFGVVKAVLLTPLPYGNPEGIAVLWSAWRGFDQTWLSYDEYEGWKADIPAFANVGLFSTGAVNLTANDESERLRAGFIDREVLPVLGVAPALGRNFTAEEDVPNGPAVILLSDDVWQRRFGADPSIVGRSIQVNGQARVVVGVMPPGFKLPHDFGGSGATLAWLPLGTTAEQNGAVPGPAFMQGGGNHGFYAVARLRAGSTVEQANRQLDNRVTQLVRDGTYPAEMQFRAFAVGVEDQVTGRLEPVLLVVFAAVGFVLLIACANVAGLLLVHGEQRRREMALRVALGAGGQRLTRQLLTETVVLAGLGAALGVALAAGGVWLVRHTAPVALPRVGETRLDPVVLAFALGIGVIAALIAGLLPAVQARSVAPGTALRDGGRSATSGPGRVRWRQTLVAIEVALAVVLVVGAGLMIRSVANLFAIDAGIRPDGVLTMRLSTPAAWYPDSIRVTAFHDELRRRVAALPGVTAVGLVRILPLATEMGDWGLQVEGYTPPEGQGTPGDWQVVTPGYFEAMGLGLVQGRFFDERDQMDAPPAMIVNRRFVELYLQGRGPLGTRVRIGGGDRRPQYTIVGVVENVRHNGLTREVKAQFYAPQPQFATNPGNTSRTMTLVVRGTADPQQLIAPVRGVIRELDPRLPISEVRTMNEVVELAIAAPRFAMELLGLFGVLALVLSAIGIFGIVAQVVASRTQEFGIRAALGATPRNLVVLSLGSGVRQAMAGLVIGVGAALLLTRTMTGMLHGVTPNDPVTFAAVVVVTAIVAVGASLIPARRAARTDVAKVIAG